MKFVERNGVKLAYREIEEAANPDNRMVFVHGMTGDHTSWKFQATHWRQQARIFSVDLRGRGYSDKPEMAYTLDLITEDLIFLIEQLELAPVVLVGHSYGGFGSLELAVRRPDLLKALVLADSYLLPERDAKWVAESQELVEGLYSENFAQVLEEFYRPLVGARSSQWLEMFMKKQLQTPLHVIASSFNELWKVDMTETAKKLELPTLYVGSCRIESGRKLKQLAPHIRLEEIPEASHLLHLDQPEKFNQYVDDFLAKL